MTMGMQTTVRDLRHKSSRSQASTSHRTSVNLTPEAVEIVQRYKDAKGISVSAAVNQLIQRSEPKPSRLKSVDGFLVLDIPYSGKPITLEDVKQAEDEMELESFERSLS
jgi:hypothetical protein